MLGCPQTFSCGSLQANSIKFFMNWLKSSCFIRGFQPSNTVRRSVTEELSNAYKIITAFFPEHLGWGQFSEADIFIVRVVGVLGACCIGKCVEVDGNIIIIKRDDILTLCWSHHQLIKLMKGKALRKQSLHEKTAASVLLKLFISSNE